MRPFFSIVVPLYNRAEVVGEAIGSVLRQGFEDFEIVVVDDGSTDGSGATVQAICDPRIRLVRQENAGGGAARSRGIEEARGQYIAFLDSDDQFLPGKLSAVQARITGAPAQVIYSRMRVDRGVDRMWVRPERGITEGEDVGEYLFCANQIMQTSTLVVPAALAREVRFDPELRRGQDLDFCVRLQRHGARFEMIDDPLVVWLDASEAGRTSYVKGYELSTFWLERCGHLLTRRARYGYRATVLAYHLAPVKPIVAARDLAMGWVAGGVPARVVARQVLRSYLPRSRYRALVNTFVGMFGESRSEPAS